MKTAFAAVLLIFIAFCGRQNPVVDADSKGRPDDTVSLFIDSVLINKVRTDTLFTAYDTASGCTLACVDIHFSRIPKTRLPALCNMVEYDNRGNDRYTCYTCLKMVRCSSQDSLDRLVLERVITFDSTLDSASGVYTVLPETSGILRMRISRNDSLGLETGSAVIRLDSLYDRVISDSTELDTSLTVYWK